LKNCKKILIIIQRSNGDVFLSLSLISAIFEYYNFPQIDLLVNDDTFQVAKLLPNINSIYTFSYQKKRESRWSQEKKIIKNIYRNYDLSINLTASDRSVTYALLASKKSISAIEKDNKKSWWKKILLTHYYYFNNNKHILINNLEPLNILKIDFENNQKSIEVSKKANLNIMKKLAAKKVNDFVIFHASTQYKYKIYPENLRNILLTSLSKLGLSILITGGNSSIDLEIKRQLPSLPNVFDFIGETSLEEFFALSELSIGYIGMDTLNMHISASQNKRIFAIFGPTNLRMWSPWSNQLRLSATLDKPIQTYGNITIFQADLPCVACGNAGCDNRHGKSECLEHISPRLVFNEVKSWYQNVRI
jgi:heptosyltransferase III